MDRPIAAGQLKEKPVFQDSDGSAVSAKPVCHNCSKLKVWKSPHTKYFLWSTELPFAFLSKFSQLCMALFDILSWEKLSGLLPWGRCKGFGQQGREGVLPFCSAVLKLHLQICLQVWVPAQEGWGASEASPEERPQGNQRDGAALL